MVTQKKTRTDLKHQYGRTELSHPHLCNFLFKKSNSTFFRILFLHEIFLTTDPVSKHLETFIELQTKYIGTKTADTPTIAHITPLTEGAVTESIIPLTPMLVTICRTTQHSLSLFLYLSVSIWYRISTDEGTIKPPIPNCRLYWCFCLG
jgi:hypothetical protein